TPCERIERQCPANSNSRRTLMLVALQTALQTGLQTALQIGLHSPRKKSGSSSGPIGPSRFGPRGPGGRSAGGVGAGSLYEPKNIHTSGPMIGGIIAMNHRGFGRNRTRHDGVAMRSNNAYIASAMAI